MAKGVAPGMGRPFVRDTVAMDRTDRVRLIREIARSAESLNWQEQDLLLREFGLPYDPGSEQDRFGYLLDHLSGGDDADLAELHRHLFTERYQQQEVPQLQPAVEGDLSAPPGRWPPNAFRLFMSHVSADKETMADLKRHLESWGVCGFVAHSDIEPTKEWIEEIELALASCDALMAYLSPTFSDSRWCDQEVGYCVGRRVLIIPVRSGLDPYGFIGRYQAVQGGGVSGYALAERLIEVLVAHRSTSLRIAPSLVRRLETSASYEGTRRVMALIEQIPSWTPELLRRMEAAAQHNDQVSEAVIRGTGQPVPERIRELLTAYGT